MKNRSGRAFLLLGLLFMSGCYAENTYQPPPPPKVQVIKPVVQTVTSYVEQTGAAQASEQVELRPRVSGFLVERNFEDGNFVKKGQLLFVIDEEPFQVKLQYARARQSEAESNLKKAEQSKSREIAQARLALSQSALNLAQANHQRNSSLLERNVVSQQEFDITEAAVREAEAQITSSRAELEQAQTNYQIDILAAQAALELAQTEVRTAQIDLGYCRITSPIDGLIDRRSADIGNYVTESNNTVLARVVRIDPIYAYTAISEDELIRIKTRYGVGAESQRIPVLMGIGDDQSFPFQGEIDYISPSVQTGTGTVQIRGIFKNTGMVMPGMFIRLKIPSEIHENALLVSERSIAHDQAGSYVYVINSKNIVERRDIVAGDTINGHRVVTGNLSPNDSILSDGLLKVRPAMEVKPISDSENQKSTAGEQSPSAPEPNEQPAEQNLGS